MTEQAQPPRVNQVTVYPSGPLGFQAELVIDGKAAGDRVGLCRCGASKNKPFCDGSHRDAGFADPGEPAVGKTDPLPTTGGPLEVSVIPNGPLKVTGNLQINSAGGQVVARTTTTYLCRCGASANKPYCDGAHSKVGFQG